MSDLNKIDLGADVPPPPNQPKKPNLIEAKQTSLLRNGENTKQKIANLKRHMPKLNPKHAKVLKLFSISLLGFCFIIFIQGLFIAIDIYQLRTSTERLINSANSQNITQMDSDLTSVQLDLERLQKSYSRIAWMSVLPLVGNYIEDGLHILASANHGLKAGAIAFDIVTPYADILGLSGGQSNPDLTAQDRLDFVIETLPEISKRVDELAYEMLIIQKHMQFVDAEDYPNTILGYDVRKQVQRALSLVYSSAKLLTDGKPLIDHAPYLLGADDTRKYLILFQNDKELRPTGGFITAYTMAEVNKARFQPVDSDDIYNLDARYTPVIAAPKPMIKHLKGVYLLNENYRLRDMNWNPDFARSMELFMTEAQKVGIEDVDGVIAVDTQLLVNILDALGPIEVPEFGKFSTEIIEECNCPQVVYELESFADTEGPVIYDPVTGDILQAPENIDNRKRIIGPLMNSILANVLGAPSHKIPGLFDAAFRSMLDKHVLLYMLDDKSQTAVESFGIAGRMMDTSGDYLHINNSNLGGRKSNLYVTTEVVQDIDVNDDGTVTKTLDITYRNPQKHDGWLNSLLPNYIRVYVPKGSEIDEADGFIEFEDPYTENDKTVFAGFLEIRPEGVSKVKITYKLPFKVGGEYPLFIQKQPGTSGSNYQVNIGNIEDEFELNSDKKLNYIL